MATIDAPTGEPKTVAELLRRLGNVPASRVRLRPMPGTAAEADVTAAHDRDGRLCELVDGVLVEKTMGFKESEVAGLILHFLIAFVRPRHLGIVTAPDGPMRLLPGLVRIPDVAFVSWDRLPGRKRPAAAVPDLAPDLAVEVLSKGNTRAEMARKLREYFAAGTRLVWLVDPRTRTVRVHSGPRTSRRLGPGDVLDGGDVLPGFTLPLQDLFPDGEG